LVEFTAEFGDGGAPVLGDGRLDARSFHRNCQPVSDELRELLAGRTGDVLEIASGTGQHVVEFARALPDITWWPSDHIPRHLDSTDGWRRTANRANLRPPILLDATMPDWPLGGADAPPANGLTAIVSLNMIHIAPWQVALGLLRGAARHLADDGMLAVYGPFKIEGRMTADSNATFDAALRNENPEWGVRDTADLRAAAADLGLTLRRIIEMPSNNFIVLFERLVDNS
jgi:hypothetical protein